MPRGERNGNKESKKPKAEKNKVKSGNTPSPFQPVAFRRPQPWREKAREVGKIMGWISRWSGTPQESRATIAFPNPVGPMTLRGTECGFGGTIARWKRISL